MNVWVNTVLTIGFPVLRKCFSGYNMMFQHRSTVSSDYLPVLGLLRNSNLQPLLEIDVWELFVGFR
jgi:hypothetical protein